MRVDPSRHLVYLSDDAANSVVVFNATSNKEVKSIAVGTKPQGLDISANGQELYVALPWASSLAIISLSTFAIKQTIPLTVAPGCVAAGVQGRAYVISSDLTGPGSNYPVVVDTNSSRQLGLITSGGVMYSGDLCITSPDRHALYLAEHDVNPSTFYRYNLAGDNGTLVKVSDWDTNPEFINDIAVSPDGSRIYLAAGAPYYIDIRYSSNFTAAGELQTGAYPTSVALTPDGRYAFAAHDTSDVDMFDVRTEQLAGAYDMGGTVQMARALSPTLVYAIVTPPAGGSEELVTVKPTTATTTTSTVTSILATTTTSTATTTATATSTAAPTTTATVTSTTTTVPVTTITTGTATQTNYFITTLTSVVATQPNLQIATVTSTIGTVTTIVASSASITTTVSSSSSATTITTSKTTSSTHSCIKNCNVAGVSLSTFGAEFDALSALATPYLSQALVGVVAGLFVYFITRKRTK